MSIHDAVTSRPDCELPVDALHGIGERQAAVLREYGIHYVGLLATTPPATIQRLLGGQAGR